MLIPSFAGASGTLHEWQNCDEALVCHQNRWHASYRLSLLFRLKAVVLPHLADALHLARCLDQVGDAFAALPVR